MELGRGHYILKDKKPIEVDLMTWAKWMEYSQEKIVKQEMVAGDYISTVFLGLDHSFSFGSHPPILFETMIFKGGMLRGDLYQARYETYEQALRAHEKLCHQWKNPIFRWKIKLGY